MVAPDNLLGWPIRRPRIGLRAIGLRQRIMALFVAAALGAGSAAALPGAQQAMRAFEIAALIAIAIALAAFVLRPMMGRTKLTPAIGAAQQAQAPGAIAIESHIDLAQVDGKVKASSLKKVADVVRTHTDESSQILKSWIREAS